MSMKPSARATIPFLLLIATALPTVSEEAPSSGGASRVLVAPVDASKSLEGDPIVEAIPALLSEAIGLRAAYPASLATDLSPSTIEHLELPEGALPTQESLSPSDAAEPLGTYGSIRILVQPELDASGNGYKLKVAWKDLAGGKKGSVSENAASKADIVGAVDRAAGSALSAWQAVWKGPAAGSKAPGQKRPGLEQVTSRSSAALSAWARARTAWSSGDVPSAERALDEALSADAGFDRARVDLAWIRLAEERNTDAEELVSAALKGSKLSPWSRAIASIIAAAAAGDVAVLDKIGNELAAVSPASPLGPLAHGLSDNIQGVHERAVAALDPIRFLMPNDPSLLHEAGLAAMGSGDDYESVLDLERAERLWPQHDRIQMDLAEAKLRAHDREGAQKVLDAWADRFDPANGPIWGGEWTSDDPPPPVRATAALTIQGAVSEAVDKLDRLSSKLAVSSAPVSLRLSVLTSLHELQKQLVLGSDMEKQRWLNAARASLKDIDSLLTPEQKKARPWFLDRLDALLRVMEGRLPEAREIRERILAASSMPGYDPGIEAEVQVAIALKEADTNTFFDAAQRAVKVRDLLSDRFRLLQGHLMARQFDPAEEAYATLTDRLRFWNGARRQDALLWSPLASVLIPYIYYVGAENAVETARVDDAKHRFGLFLAYFQRPDPKFEMFAREAANRGARPAW